MREHCICAAVIVEGYVDRVEGLALQLAAGIPSARRGGYGTKLTSEDLY